MPTERLSVVVTRRLPEVVEVRMKELFNAELRTDDKKMSREELAQAMKRADVLVPCVTDQIDAGLLAQAGDRLKLIANYGAGVDHIDVHTARQRGILVSNTPGVVTDDTADMTLALILAVTRRIPGGPCRDAGRTTGTDGRRRPSWGGDWAAAGLAFSGWAGSVRPWHAGRARSGCRSTITTASDCAPRSRRTTRRPGGKASTRWSAGSTSCRSTARIRRRPST